MNSKSCLLVLTSCFIPVCSFADAPPLEPNYCASGLPNMSNGLQENTAKLCSGGEAMKAAIDKYQQQKDSSTQSGNFGGTANIASASPYSANATNNVAPTPPTTGVAATPQAAPTTPSASGGAATNNIYSHS